MLASRENKHMRMKGRPGNEASSNTSINYTYCYNLYMHWVHNYALTLHGQSLYLLPYLKEPRSVQAQTAESYQFIQH